MKSKILPAPPRPVETIGAFFISLNRFIILLPPPLLPVCSPSLSFAFVTAAMVLTFRLSLGKCLRYAVNSRYIARRKHQEAANSPRRCQHTQQQNLSPKLTNQRVTLPTPCAVERGKETTKFREILDSRDVAGCARVRNANALAVGRSLLDAMLGSETEGSSQSR